MVPPPAVKLPTDGSKAVIAARQAKTWNDFWSTTDGPVNWKDVKQDSEVDNCSPVAIIKTMAYRSPNSVRNMIHLVEDAAQIALPGDPLRGRTRPGCPSTVTVKKGPVLKSKAIPGPPW